MAFLEKLLIIAAATLVNSVSMQTPEESIISLRHNFSIAALLNGITLPDISYYVPELIDTPIIGRTIVETYDFIIIGAGSAGTILANRLSENPNWKVLLLETGTEPDFLSDIPALSALQLFSWHNWGYLMERQDNMCLGLTDQLMHWPRGRGLGGSSLINTMIHVRGNKLDYDGWAGLGNDGWSYADVLPYFKNFEHSIVRTKDRSYRGTFGELSVQDVSYRTKSADAFVAACEQLGYSYVDYNGKNQMGVSYVQATTRRGLRCSGEKAFLRPVKNRLNLRIRINSHVTKILLDASKRVTGVQFVRNGQIHTAKASKEVILSAGTFNSPQLLMLSGIGPAPHLQEFGIPVVQDLPVGQKLYDHLSFIGLIFTVNDSIGFDFTDWVHPLNFIELYLNGTGPLGSAGGVESLAYLKTRSSGPDYPDVELLFIGGQLHVDHGLFFARMFRVSDTVYDALFRPLEGKNAVGAFPMLLHPKSYGRVQLRSTNAFDYPKLYGNYFTDPDGHDVKTFIASIREIQRIFKTPAFQKYNARLVETPVPGCESEQFDSDAYWECALRSISVTLHHQIATCKMGPKTDPEAVVDNRLRVHGMKNLRVVDSSVIPVTLSAHTNVPTYMVGEKAAAMIKEDWSM